MGRMSSLGSRARWAVPAAIITVIGVGIAATALASANSVPSLPHRTPAQLLVSLQQAMAKPQGPMTATLQAKTSLGLPDLPDAGSIPGLPGVLSGLTDGSNSISIWYLNSDHIRIAKPVEMGESDLRLDGRQLWLWSSQTQTATRVLLPAGFGMAGRQAAGARPGMGVQVPNSAPGGSATAPTPQQIARQVLAAVGPTTSVRLAQNTTVAGQAAYQLAIAPRSAQSLVGSIVIAVDASRSLPLRVQVFARGSSSPEFQYGFSSLSFGKPAASNFSFTPPHGVKVKTIRVPASLPGSLAGGPLGPLAALEGLAAPTTMAGAPVISRVAIKATLGNGEYPLGARPAGPSRAMLRQIRKSFLASLPRSMSAAQRARAIRQFDRAMQGKAAMVVTNLGNNGGGFVSAGTPITGRLSAQARRRAEAQMRVQLGRAARNEPKVVGKGWLSVIVTPANPRLAALLSRPAGSGWTAYSPLGSASSTSTSGSASSAYSSTLKVYGPGVRELALIRMLLRAATPVSGSWGRGRLLRTSLVSVLLTSNGRFLIGAVTPSVLYADAAATRAK